MKTILYLLSIFALVPIYAFATVGGGPTTSKSDNVQVLEVLVFAEAKCEIAGRVVFFEELGAVLTAAKANGVGLVRITLAKGCSTKDFFRVANKSTEIGIDVTSGNTK